MDRYLLVALFGAAGAVSRYAVDAWIGPMSRGQFPWSTLAVNVFGAFALGVLIELTLSRVLPYPNWRIALGVGFLGAFTTFSTYAYETVRLAEDSAWSLALLNTFGLIFLGLAAAYAGIVAGRAI